ncbi:MAG: WecB/TagA/CpsF family glycosyltransferase [Opitutales bacterium]|nr:WecB/TagA/CpsF family glycosyltransferase [Opitutales bacterium]
MESLPTVRILGLPLYNGPAPRAVDWIMEHGGLMTVPSAPCMILASRNPAFYEAMASSRLILPDSGYMTLIWRLRRGERINRVSGYEFLEYFFPRPELREPGALFRIEPGERDAAIHTEFLREAGIPATEDDHYIAPMYPRDNVADPALLERVLERRPKYILINLGGGVQEFLGAYLQRGCEARFPGERVPSLLCTGGAIGFFSASQVRIPRWADRLFLGWLVRTLSDPVRFGPRFAKSFVLGTILLRWGARRPRM